MQFRYNLQKVDIILTYVKNSSLYYFQLASLFLNAKPSKYNALRQSLQEISYHAAENWKLPSTGKPWPVWLEDAITSGKKRAKIKKASVCQNTELNWFLRSTCTLSAWFWKTLADPASFTVSENYRNKPMWNGHFVI